MSPLFLTDRKLKLTLLSFFKCTPQDDDVGGDAAFWEYLVALLGSMAALPGLVACGFLMGRVGRINMLCGGLFTAMILALFLPLAMTAEAALLAILCLFSGLTHEK